MQSALRRAAAEPATALEPTVTFDGKNRIVTLTVVVSLNLDDSLHIAVAPASIPQDDWTFFWDLVPDTGLQVSFGDPGIILPPSLDPPLGSLPPNVTVIEQPSGSATRWTTELRNKVVGTNALNYAIDVERTLNVDGKLVVLKTQIKDPSIAVTTDPPPGG